MESIRLRSVNWEHGMLLTPQHFLRQEHYFESLFHWSAAYLTQGSGLVGGGIRSNASDLGAVRHDPVVALEENIETLSVSVSQCRGITPSGLIVDIDASSAISERFRRESLAGVAEALVYVVCDSASRRKTDDIADEFNPQMKTERAFSYRIALDVTAAERPDAIAIARLERPAVGLHYEKDADYIPPCVSLAAHSELTAGWRRIVDAVTALASGYAELHRAMREFLVLFTERGIETEVDRDAIDFAERMLIALQETAYAVLDRTQPPGQFFGEIRKLLHKAATFFDLAPGMQQYYETLRETGETELVALIGLQRQMLQTGRSLRLADDLGVELRTALQSLSVLAKLEWALEGKYIDFRRSPSLDGMNFIFDRGGKVLYKLAAKPSRVQGVVDELSIFFSQLRLEGRDRYRLILVGNRDAPYLKGTSISAEIRLNEGSGFRREAIILTTEAKLDDQYNFEFDFEAPDVPTITDLRVTVQAFHAVRTALLFTRHRFYAGRTGETPSAGLARSVPTPSPFSSVHGVPVNQDGSADSADLPEYANHSEPVTAHPAAAPPPSSEDWDETLPPWSPRPRGPHSNGSNGDNAARPRRRRLE
jgi:hypothetical protein